MNCLATGNREGHKLRIVVWMSVLLAITTAAAHAATPASKLDLRAVPVPPPMFSSLPPRWRSFATSGDLTPRGAQAGVFATSWPYRLTTVDGPGGSMPPNAILVNVSLIRSNPGTQTGSLCGRTPHIAGYPPRRRRRSKGPHGLSTVPSAASATRTTSRSGSRSVTDIRRQSCSGSLASLWQRSSSRAGQRPRPAESTDPQKTTPR